MERCLLTDGVESWVTPDRATARDGTGAWAGVIDVIRCMLLSWRQGHPRAKSLKCSWRVAIFCQISIFLEISFESYGVMSLAPFLPCALLVRCV